MIIQCHYCPKQSSNFTEAIRHLLGKHKKCAVIPVLTNMVTSLASIDIIGLPEPKVKTRLGTKTGLCITPSTEASFEEFKIDFCNPHSCPIWASCQGANPEFCHYWEEYKYKHGG